MITNQLYDYVHSGDVKRSSDWLNKHPRDLNAAVGDGYSPLHVACLFGHESLANLLISHGALVNVAADNSSLATPLHVAVMYRDEETANRIVSRLLECGAELNARQIEGLTALHHAVSRGSLKLVETLICAGADPFMKDDRGRTAFEFVETLRSEAPKEQIRTVLKSAFSLTIQP